MSLLLLQKKKRRVQKKDATLKVHAGSFRLTGSGIESDLSPPLSRLSGKLSWSAVPVGIATMKMVLLGCGSGDSAHRLLHRFHVTEEEQDRFAEDVGVVWIGSSSPDMHLATMNPWCESMLKIMDWCDVLIRECPYRSASYDIGRVRKMNDEQLEGFVMKYLG